MPSTCRLPPLWSDNNFTATADNFCTGRPRPRSLIPSFPYHKRGTERDWERLDFAVATAGLRSAAGTCRRDLIVDCAASTSGNSYRTGATPARSSHSRRPAAAIHAERPSLVTAS